MNSTIAGNAGRGEMLDKLQDPVDGIADTVAMKIADYEHEQNDLEHRLEIVRVRLYRLRGAREGLSNPMPEVANNRRV